MPAGKFAFFPVTLLVGLGIMSHGVKVRTLACNAHFDVTCKGVWLARSESLG